MCGECGLGCAYNNGAVVVCATALGRVLCVGLANLTSKLRRGYRGIPDIRGIKSRRPLPLSSTQKKMGQFFAVSSPQEAGLCGVGCDEFLYFPQRHRHNPLLVFSKDGWKLRHLLLSLRIFRIDLLYDLVVEIGQDLLANGINLNLQDAGFEEALHTMRGETTAATQWVKVKLHAKFGKKWIPTLEELLFAPIEVGGDD